MNIVYSFSNRDCKHITRKPSLRLIPYINHVLRSRVQQLFYYCGAFGEGLFFDHGSGSCFITVASLVMACSSITDASTVLLLRRLWWEPVLRSLTQQLFPYCGIFGEGLFFDHGRVGCFITVTPLVMTCSSITDASAVLLLWRLWWGPVLRSRTHQLCYYCDASREGLFFDHGHVNCFITLTHVLFCFAFANLYSCCPLITTVTAVLNCRAFI